MRSIGDREKKEKDRDRIRSKGWKSRRKRNLLRARER
jgi:hypothetical protein